MKKIKVISIMILFLLLCSCTKGSLHSEEELLEYADDIICNPRTNEKCNLKDKYKVKKIQETDEERTLILKLNDIDLEFEVKSYPYCTGDIDGSCFTYEYRMTDTYSNKLFLYYIDEYNKTINYEMTQCNKNPNRETCNDYLIIRNKKELQEFIDYYKGFINYINKQELLLPTNSFGIDIEVDNAQYKSYHLNIGIELLDGKYYPVYYRDYAPLDGEVETYLSNYLYKNGIELN